MLLSSAPLPSCPTPCADSARSANASSDFLESKGIKVSKVELVAKLSKDLLASTYKELFAANAFRDASAEAAKKAAIEQQKAAEAAAAQEEAAPEPVVEAKEEKIYFKKEVIKKVR